MGQTVLPFLTLRCCQGHPSTDGVQGVIILCTYYASYTHEPRSRSPGQRAGACRPRGPPLWVPAVGAQLCGLNRFPPCKGVRQCRPRRVGAIAIK